MGRWIARLAVVAVILGGVFMLRSMAAQLARMSRSERTAPTGDSELRRRATERLKARGRAWAKKQAEEQAAKRPAAPAQAPPPVSELTGVEDQVPAAEDGP